MVKRMFRNGRPSMNGASVLHVHIVQPTGTEGDLLLAHVRAKAIPDDADCP